MVKVRSMKKIVKNTRKGVSIVELVIALSVIMIVTVAAISMLHTAIKIETKSASIIEANNTAESIIEIYRYSQKMDDEEECEDIFKDMLGSLSDNGIDDSQEGDGYKPYVLDRGAYNITIKYYTYKIEINASFKDGTEIYKNITYYKKG